MSAEASIILLYGNTITDFRAICFFDEAFASHIHISIHYGDLGKEGRQVTWENLLKDLEREHPKVFIEYSARAYVTKDGALKSLEWNGQRIRNDWRPFELNHFMADF